MGWGSYSSDSHLLELRMSRDSAAALALLSECGSGICMHTQKFWLFHMYSTPSYGLCFTAYWRPVLGSMYKGSNTCRHSPMQASAQAAHVCASDGTGTHEGMPSQHLDSALQEGLLSATDIETRASTVSAADSTG